MTATEPPTKKPSNLVVRIAAAAVLVPLALFVAWLGGTLFNAFIALAGTMMALEWRAMVKAGIPSRQSRLPWYLIGLVYILLPLVALILLRSDPHYGLIAVVFLFACVWTADSLAYFAGRTFGGPKLWPAVSPNKTWSGFFGAVFGGMVAAMLVFFFSELNNLTAAALIGAAIGGLEQGGDLFESALKRKFGVKDSGSSIPGHGGVLDRVDGLVAAVIAAWLFGAVRSESWTNAATGLLNWS